ncbi:PAS domain-containing protein [Tropicimonas isoalkanivorans]|nr:PAS domain-containing protein [Tropicimonas isoalkanivorans]
MTALTSQFPMIATVEAYWDALRGDRQIPPRSEVDPRGLGNSLPCCFILERLAPGVARFRLSGTHLNDILGMEVRGMPLTALFLPESRSQVSTALERVFDLPGRAHLSLAGDRGIGKPPMDAALLLLPLMSDLGEVTRVLGCLPTLGPVGRTPRRFEVRQSRITPLTSARTPATQGYGWPDRNDRDSEHLTNEMAEPAAGYAPGPKPQSSGGKPYLYLVSSKDD